jgi:hypothetical protein
MSKPCTDCPNQPGQDEKGEPTIPDVIMPEKMPNVGWVIYTGGPPERHLSMMQHTLPKDYTRGRFLPDGSLQYENGPDGWEPPSPVEGYERDAEDAWLFRPLWKSCQLRMYGTVIKESCECIQVLAVCSHPETKLNEHGEVTFDMCETCPWRSPIPVPLVPQSSPKPIPFRTPGSAEASQN